MVYKEENDLQCSGIQHFKFCRRQWTLIYIENRWAENNCTVGGEIVHERAHDSGMREKRGGLVITRDMRIASSTKIEHFGLKPAYDSGNVPVI